MMLVSPTKGYKRRENAIAKLREVGESLPAECDGVRGTIIANSDGTFTPCMFLTDRATVYCRQIVDRGVYVIG